MKKSTCLLSTLLLFTLALAGPLGAATVSYTTTDDFTANTTNDTSYTFSGFTGTNNGVPSPYTYGPVSFASGPGGGLTQNNDNSYGQGVEYLSSAGSMYGAGLTLTLPSTTYSAFALTLGAYNGADTFSIAVTLGVGSTTTFTLTETASQPTTAFIGFASTLPFNDIASVAITDTTKAFNEIDVTSFTVGTYQAGAVPEPSAWTLLAGGGLLMVLVQKFRRRSPASLGAAA